MLDRLAPEIDPQHRRRGQPARGDAQRHPPVYRLSPRPGGEVSFQGGYPFAPDSTVDVTVGGQTFKLFTEGENAWTGSPDEDAKLIAALRGGSEAVVKGRSTRGTRTTDTFSLMGLTAMSNMARDNCK